MKSIATLGILIAANLAVPAPNAGAPLNRGRLFVVPTPAASSTAPTSPLPSPALSSQPAVFSPPRRIDERYTLDVLARVASAGIPVYLPLRLPRYAPRNVDVTVEPGGYRIELAFTPACDGAHVCHFASTKSGSTVVPLEPATDVSYGGQTMQYHAPLCAAYCADGGLYFKIDGVPHAIEARAATLERLEFLYDSYTRVR